MILPSKHLPQDRALLTVGARILHYLSFPMPISSLWEELRGRNEKSSKVTPVIHYESFVLALDLLFLMGVIDIQEGLLTRRLR